MKRVIQRKAKQSICDGSSELGDSLKKQKRASQDIGNKTRTSAAMLGLALSMGASGSILSCHSKSAMAADTKLPVDVSSVEGSSGDLAGGSSEVSLDLESAEDSSEVSHVIREGETLWTISNRYNISSDSLIHANGFREDVVLRVGQKVVLPVDSIVSDTDQVLVATAVDDLEGVVDIDSPEENLAHRQIEDVESLKQDLGKSSGNVVPKVSAPSKDFSQALASTESENISVVVDVQTLAKIEKESFVEVESFDSSSESSFIGDSYDAEPVVVAQHVAFSDVETVEPSSVFDLDVTVPSTHQIRVGETLADIARRYNISTDQLAEVNRIRNPNRIFAGRVLNLPPGASISSAVDVVGETSVVPSTLTPEIQVDLPEVERVVSLPRASDLEDSDLLNAPDVTPSATVVPAVDGSFYVDRLLGEIEKLSEGYRSTPSVQPEESSVAQVEEVASEPDQVAYVPGIASESQVLDVSERLQVLPESAEVEKFSDSVDTEPLDVDGSALSSQSSPELIAAAPLGSENYVPLNQPVTGRMVSPDLPPLTGPENYLPSGSSSFNGYKYPAQGTLTSGYGWRWGRMHRGIDVAAPIGTPIVAAAPGVIEYSGWNSGGYGNMVEVRHPDGSMTRYAHNSRNLVRVGQQVAQGEQIAEMGSTGYSTGPHVHFEIHMPEQGTVNPVAYLSQ